MVAKKRYHTTLFPIHVGINKSEKIKQAFWRDKNPEEFKEI